MEIIRIVTILFLCTLISCGIKNKGSNLVKESDGNELQFSNEINFEIIKEWVNGKRIVSIGESTHGIGDFYSLKSEIVQYLHQELGYEVLAMEGGFADINLGWLDLDNLSSKELRDKTLYGNFNCQEIISLFKYLKDNSNTENPLIYSGFDSEESGRYYRDWIKTISKHLDLNIDVNKEFSAYNKMYQASTQSDSINFNKYKDAYQSILTTLNNSISNNRKSLQKELKLSSLQLSIIIRNIENQYSIVDYNYSERINSQNMQQGIANRDKLMAENLTWLIETLYPEKKIIVWAHNGHIEKNGRHKEATKMMGHYLMQKYADKYLAIGLFAYKGKTYSHWTGNSIEFENSDSASIEFIMKRDNYKFSYQKFENRNMSDWTNREVNALEVENGGIKTFVPSQRFDAAINISNVDIPTFIDKK